MRDCTNSGEFRVTQPAPLLSIAGDLKRVESALLSVAPPLYPELGDLIRGLISAGGKRLRPAIVLLAARASG